jgi:hypothetical protein
MDILYNNIGVWNWDSYLTNVSDHLIANEKKKKLTIHLKSKKFLDEHYYYILNVAMNRIYLNKILCLINAWMNLFLFLVL